MAQMFNISDNESETSEDREDPDQTEHNSGLKQRKQFLSAPDSLKGESVTRACGIVTHVISYPGYTSLHIYKMNAKNVTH